MNLLWISILNVLEILDPDALERSRGVQHFLRYRDGRSREMTGLEDRVRHPVHSGLVEASDETSQSLLLIDLRQFPPVHTRACDTEPVAVPLGAQPFPLLGSEVKDRVYECDREVGRIERVRETGSRNRERPRNRVNYLNALGCNSRHPRTLGV